jgi:hypothetical protein
MGLAQKSRKVTHSWTLPAPSDFNQPPLMGRKKIQDESDMIGPTRMATRSKNATTHPGAILQEAQRVRRTKEEIAEEKELKIMQEEAKRQKKIANNARKANGEAHLKRLEEVEGAGTANAESEFPRHRGLRQSDLCHSIINLSTQSMPTYLAGKT